MHAVVALLDAPHYELVEELWARMAQKFGLRGIYQTPFSHFSYQVAPHYDLTALEPVMREIAASQPPFRVRTAGLGIFTGPQPVVYLPVVRSPELTRFHAAIWPRLAAAGTGLLGYYRPESWVPHITMAFGDVSAENLGAVVTWLNEQDLDWELDVGNLSLIYNDGTRQGLKWRIPLTG